MSRLGSIDDFDHVQRAKIIRVAGEKRQLMFMSLSSECARTLHEV